MNRLLVDVAWLAAQLQHPELVILDATVNLKAPRYDGDYQVESGAPSGLEQHLPHARHADLLHDLHDLAARYSFAMPPLDRLAASLRQLGISDHSRVVIYDRAEGFWAARLWWMLRSVGLAPAILDGGLHAWQQAGQPTLAGMAGPRPTTAPLTLRKQPGYWASLEQVKAVSEQRTPGRLVCALSQAVFEGATATRYSRRGHIPNSLNRPARQLFDDTGRYHPQAVLRERLGADLLQGPVLLYCGGGISAAATAFALALLGQWNVSLYDGSLQQWSADPALPMSTGAAPA
ncbi:MAG: rhodanese-like domain-containing protein [Pseudomonas sp.]|uniref:sulfurtransferase n=1 Tax=Pseudomonas abieticivorans TaxID=2931382 RepID=UPI0020BF6F5D|nr:rhodanese-like domain-containing protein [Pseudomonas sp. PIA16]MDE1169451.1 rhodanese-like domain-containing protein [Pseudomonas sp.]